MGEPTQIFNLAGRQFSLRANDVERPLADAPLIVALHGGGYTSAYFDIEGCSLLERCRAIGIPAIAIDRPGYGDSEITKSDDCSHAANAAILDAAIGAWWNERGNDRPGIVLIGHSIGGAIALMIASCIPAWPLLGVAVSGIGLRNAPGDLEAWQSLPPIDFIDFPPALKDEKMFGPTGTYDPAALRHSHAADAPASRQELIDIVTAWPLDAEAWLSKITAPVHYRQSGNDALWEVSTAEVERFGAACTAAPWVDAALVEYAGHCIDFHKLGPSFQLDQLAFALECAVLSRARR